MVHQVVVDTNVLLSGLRSRQGASFRLLSLIGVSRKFEINLSVPLVFEYEDVIKRHKPDLGLSEQDIDDLIDYLCSVANLHKIFFLWRPFLKDPKDDLVLELAVEAECEAIITFNARDFIGAEQFGIGVLAPREFLREIKEIR